MKLKVPFRYGILIIEKSLDFEFCIATLEWATNRILKCGLENIKEVDPVKLSTAVLYSAYVIACRFKDKPVRPRYTFAHAEIWVRHMNKDTQAEFFESMQGLLGEMRKGEDKKKI